jgi:hypothetical protein
MKKSKTSSSKKSKTAKKSSSKSTKTEVSAIGTLSKSTDRTKFSESTWVVFRGQSGERKPMLFSGKLSRDRVRGAYAKITGTNKDRTRSRRLSNY